MTFARNLLVIRKFRGLTQEALGALINSNKQAISGYEKGKNTPYGSTMTKIAKALNVTVEDLTSEAFEVKNLTTFDKEVNASDNQKNKSVVSNAIEYQFSSSNKVRYVPITAQAGYVMGIANPLYERELLMIDPIFPIANPKNHIYFQVAGDSMTEPYGKFKGLQEGDIVDCKQLNIGKNTPFIKDRVFVVVLKPSESYEEGGILVKMLKEYNEETGIMHFISTNTDFKPIDIDIRDVQQLWYVKNFINFNPQ